MRNVKIVSTGSYVPQKILTNQDLSKRVETSDEWIVSRTGIRERRVIAKGQTCSDLAFEASKSALQKAGLSPEDLDMIILATLTPDKRLPASANFLQEKLGAKNAAVFDINVACSGFVYGMSIAMQYIRTGEMKHVLVVGAEVMTEILNWKDRGTCILFGDGAGAAILGPAEASDEHELLSTHLFSNGALWPLLNIPAGGTEMPWTAEVFERGDHLVQIALRKANLKISDIDVFIPHQANLRIIDAISKRLDFPKEKIFVNVDKYGNTSAASIPLALDEAVRTSFIKKGNLILIVTFGAGFAWGSALVKW